jgi:hypothetical protein
VAVSFINSLLDLRKTVEVISTVDNWKTLEFPVFSVCCAIHPGVLIAGKPAHYLCADCE